jgi:hypothetical protein
VLTDAQGRPIYGPGPAGPGYGAPPWPHGTEGVETGTALALGIPLLVGFGAYAITEGEAPGVRLGATALALLASGFGVLAAARGGYLGEARSW